MDYEGNPNNNCAKNVTCSLCNTIFLKDLEKCAVTHRTQLAEIWCCLCCGARHLWQTHSCWSRWHVRVQPHKPWWTCRGPAVASLLVSPSAESIANSASSGRQRLHPGLERQNWLIITLQNYSITLKWQLVTRAHTEITHIKGDLLDKCKYLTLTESSGYIMQCSITPAMAPALICVTTFAVGKVS